MKGGSSILWMIPIWQYQTPVIMYMEHLVKTKFHLKKWHPRKQKYCPGRQQWPQKTSSFYASHHSKSNDPTTNLPCNTREINTKTDRRIKQPAFSSIRQGQNLSVSTEVTPGTASAWRETLLATGRRIKWNVTGPSHKMTQCSQFSKFKRFYNYIRAPRNYLQILQYCVLVATTIIQLLSRFEVT